MRRRTLLLAAPSLGIQTAWLATPAGAAPAPAAHSLKQGFAQRLKRLLAAGELPYVDMESSCDPARLDIDELARQMDRLNIGLMALSADISKAQFQAGVRPEPLWQRLSSAYPDRFIPVGNGGQPPVLTEDSEAFLDGQAAAAKAGQILLLGEYEFRHYPSPRQVRRGAEDRDVAIALDGPIGQRVFALSQSSGLPVQLHYEIEDELLPALERMLAQYPGARVIWCHLAQVRYIERAPHYSPAYVERLLQRFPQLYFDTAFGDARSVYPLSQQRHSRIWGPDGDLQPGWRDLIVAYPTRFLSALDLGADRMGRIAEYDQRHRAFLARLPESTRHQLAYRNAWALLFGEDFD